MPGRPHPERGRVRGKWEEAFRSPPPPYLSVQFMEKALSYDAQCRASGGLSAKLRRTLMQIAKGDAVPDTGGCEARAGTHLVREWNGRTYQVEVLEHGYRMDGKTWTSLSAIAGHITGTNWSGPRFFGLTRKRSE